MTDYFGGGYFVKGHSVAPLRGGHGAPLIQAPGNSPRHIMLSMHHMLQNGNGSLVRGHQIISDMYRTICASGIPNNLALITTGMMQQIHPSGI